MWFENDEILYYLPKKNCSYNKFASFDLDYTLIKTKTGKKFPVDNNDWVLLNENVKNEINKLIDDKYQIVIFSNQSKLKDSSKIEGFKNKIESIINTLGVDIQVFISKKSGYYRKPMTGMWDKMLEINNISSDINNIICRSFYCGDAAGRIDGWKKNTKKDFAATDRMFANNIGIKFQTPEYTFNKEDESIEWKLNKIILENYLINEKTDNLYKSFVNTEQELIIMCGFPGSTKSSFCKKYFELYKIINQDILKTKNKCLKETEIFLKDKYSVIIDNTNLNEESRKSYIKLGKKYNLPIKVIWINIPIELSKHLNNYRCQKTFGKTKIIPDIVYNSMKKKNENTR